MSRELELLALRKELLLTRASVERLRVVQQVDAVREQLRLPHVVRSLARSKGTRGALLSLVLMLAGPGRFGRWLRRAAMLMSVAGVARTAFEAARATCAARSGSTEKPPAP